MKRRSKPASSDSWPPGSRACRPPPGRTPTPMVAIRRARPASGGTHTNEYGGSTIRRVRRGTEHTNYARATSAIGRAKQQHTAGHFATERRYGGIDERRLRGRRVSHDAYGATAYHPARLLRRGGVLPPARDRLPLPLPSADRRRLSDDDLQRLRLGGRRSGDGGRGGRSIGGVLERSGLVDGLVPVRLRRRGRRAPPPRRPTPTLPESLRVRRTRLRPTTPVSRPGRLRQPDIRPGR